MNHSPSLGVILSAGGVGARMKMPTPKQFLELNGKPVILKSLNVFLGMPEVAHIVIVCDPLYRHLIPTHSKISFALPGARRQDSSYNGLQALPSTISFVCTHDAVRPFIDVDMVQRVYRDAQEIGAATAGMPVKFTVKESAEKNIVKQTLERSKIWEIQTPQIVRRDWLIEGFAHVNGQNLTVTDDVSVIELLGHPVKLTEGSYRNLKITTPEDLDIAKAFCH